MKVSFFITWLFKACPVLIAIFEREHEWKNHSRNIYMLPDWLTITTTNLMQIMVKKIPVCGLLRSTVLSKNKQYQLTNISKIQKLSTEYMNSLQEATKFETLFHFHAIFFFFFMPLPGFLNCRQEERTIGQSKKKPLQARQNSSL